ncbi:MAG: type IV pilus modification PilV family protein [Candidatus Ratteibacteria bacterium]
MVKNEKGLTLIEVVISIFLIAAVIATGLLILSGNLNVIKKANELTIANALLQYSIEEIKNIDFPPVYYDRQNEFGDEVETESIIDVNLYTDFTPDFYKNDYRIIRFVQGIDSSGNIIQNFNNTMYDNAMALKITIYILRRRGNQVLLKSIVYRSRDGLY